LNHGSAATLIRGGVFYATEIEMRAMFLSIALAGCSPQAGDPPPPEEQTAAPASAGGTEVNLAAMPAWREARRAGVDFRGVGQEPGWMIDIYQRDRIVVLLDYGETLIEFPRTEPTYPVEGVTRYDTRSDEGGALGVSIRRFPCQDSMSGEAFPATVEINISGRTLSGCGRSV
jgi:uncharacterized membrane protein